MLSNERCSRQALFGCGFAAMVVTCLQLNFGVRWTRTHSMRPSERAVLLLSVICTVLGCRDRPSAQSDTKTVSVQGCAVARGDVRLTADSLGGLSTRSSIGALRELCPNARMDTVGVGGTSAPALRIDAPGVTVWAIQTAYDAYGDTLHAAEPADLWAASGDSLRFPDGTLIPCVGALRILDSVGVIVVDHGDDSGGSYIIRCKFPDLQIIIDNDWPPFAQTGIVRLAQVSPSDTTQAWRVEISSRQRDAAVEKACPRAPAT